MERGSRFDGGGREMAQTGELQALLKDKGLVAA